MHREVFPGLFDQGFSTIPDRIAPPQAWRSREDGRMARDGLQQIAVGSEGKKATGRFCDGRSFLRSPSTLAHHRSGPHTSQHASTNFPEELSAGS